MASQSSAGSGLPGRQVLIVFLLFIIVGGGASVAIRITYGALAPFWSATACFGLAATAFWIMVLIKRLPLPRGRTLLGAVIFGVLTVGLAFILIGWGLVETPASTYQVLMALMPLLTLFLSALHGVDHLETK